MALNLERGILFSTFTLHSNDADLNLQMREPPYEGHAAKVMTFCLIPYEAMRISWKIHR